MSFILKNFKTFPFAKPPFFHAAQLVFHNAEIVTTKQEKRNKSSEKCVRDRIDRRVCSKKRNVRLCAVCVLCYVSVPDELSNAN